MPARPRAAAQKPLPRARTTGAKPAGPVQVRATPTARPKPPAKAKPEPATTAKRQVAAGPEAAPKRPRGKVKLAPDRLEELVAAVRASLEDDKAEDIVVLDVTGRSDVTDRMILATGQVERQLQAMATHVEDALEKAGMKIRRNKIEASPDWVLIDAGDLLIHLFRPEMRVTYGLERMWGPQSPAPEGPSEG
nr:ribosome silencing factor [Dankookia rubra]